MTWRVTTSAVAEAVADGASAARVALVAGHPGFPVTPILERLDDPSAPWSFHLAINERVGVDMCVGASLARARSLAVMKSHGASTVLDPLQNWSLIGVEAGAVILVGDDVDVLASQHGADSRGLAILARVPVLEPSDADELQSMLPDAFALSEEVDCPVVVRITADLEGVRGAHVHAAVGTMAATRPVGFRRAGRPYFAGPVNHPRLRQRAEARVAFIRSRSWPRFNRLTRGRDVAAGERRAAYAVAGTTHQRVRTADPGASVLRCGLVYPLSRPDLEQLRRDAGSAPAIVAEIGDPILAAQVREATDPRPAAAACAPPGARPSLDSSLCPQCPHRLVLYLLKSLDAPVMGDAGCSALAAGRPLEVVSAHTAMGSSIGMATGISVVTGDHAIAVTGDSAFRHSGVTALMNAVTIDASILVLLLDNGGAAMTGGQVCGSVRLRAGAAERAARWRALLEGVGVNEGAITITDAVFSERRVREALRDAWERRGVRVLVVVGECAFGRDERPPPTRVALEPRRGHPAAADCPAIAERGARGVLVRADLCGACTLCEAEP